VAALELADSYFLGLQVVCETFVTEETYSKFSGFPFLSRSPDHKHTPQLSRRSFSAMVAQRRLSQLLSELRPTPAPVGTLKLGDITYDVPVSLTPSRLPHSGELLDIQDPMNLDNLHFMLQKYLLGQDIFLVSQPGPYARRLALTFAW